jgi:hypothetical protein
MLVLSPNVFIDGCEAVVLEVPLDHHRACVMRSSGATILMVDSSFEGSIHFTSSPR